MGSCGGKAWTKALHCQMMEEHGADVNGLKSMNH